MPEMSSITLIIIAAMMAQYVVYRLNGIQEDGGFPQTDRR
jgi:hypothetical protein